MSLLADHRKWPEFKTVLAKTISQKLGPGNKMYRTTSQGNNHDWQNIYFFKLPRKGMV